MDYQRQHHSVHLVVYHLIWCPKRRCQVLHGPVHDRLVAILHAVAEEHHWQIIRLAVQPDHVHLFLRATPSTLPTDIPRRIKVERARFARGIPASATHALAVDPQLLHQHSGQCEPGNHPAVH
jgi:putative transposase